MANVKVIRVVGKDGRGLYHSGLFEQAGADVNGDRNHHPAPWEDRLLKQWFNKTSSNECNQFSYCFATEKQFLQWVYLPEWRHKMTELGGKLLVIEINYTNRILGDTQAVYRTNSVISSKEFPINSFDSPDLAAIIREYLYQPQEATQ